MRHPLAMAFGFRSQALAGIFVFAAVSIARPVVALKKIEIHVRIAAAQTRLRVPIHVVPFAGHGHQGEYIN